jgi:hypothetical protein
MTASELARDAERLGATLGLMVRYGAPNVQAAVQACREGRATETQQHIVVELLEAAAGGPR